MSDNSWQPKATFEVLRQRAQLLASVRQFFAERKVLEVETPLLASYSVTDPHMPVISTLGPEGKVRYLQTSPEYAMKRLLVAGSGPIYQLSKAFRAEEQSRRHNPEFTMLEWYRPGFDEHQLMDEVSDLLMTVMGTASCERITYRDLFKKYFDIDIHATSCEQLEAIARSRLDVQMENGNYDDWLNLLLAEVVEPRLGEGAPLFLHDYPPSQAALARVGEDGSGKPVARRFELYYRGMELANGYYELADAQQLRRRFELENDQRKDMGKPAVELDQFLLAAMEQGLPECAGVALGIDRLMMIKLGVDRIDEVLAFSEDNS